MGELTVLYYYEAEDAPEEEKRELRRDLRRLEKDLPVRVKYERTVQISGLQVRNGESYQGKTEIMEGLREIRSRLEN